MIAAVVPAAGSSLRMGRPKLLLDVGGETLIERVVQALRNGGADPVLVVAPPEGIEGARDVAARARARGAQVIVPTSQPNDMRGSVELALAWLEARPQPPTAILLTPADSPGLSAATVRLLVETAAREPRSILVLTHRKRRGHPVLLPWSLARMIPGLPAAQGVNGLLAQRSGDVVEVEVEDPSVTIDLDTPDEYRRWREREP